MYFFIIKSIVITLFYLCKEEHLNKEESFPWLLSVSYIIGVTYFGELRSAAP